MSGRASGGDRARLSPGGEVEDSGGGRATPEVQNQEGGLDSESQTETLPEAPAERLEALVRMAAAYEPSWELDAEISAQWPALDVPTLGALLRTYVNDVPPEHVSPAVVLAALRAAAETLPADATGPEAYDAALGCVPVVLTALWHPAWVHALYTALEAQLVHFASFGGPLVWLLAHSLAPLAVSFARELTEHFGGAPEDYFEALSLLRRLHNHPASAAAGVGASYWSRAVLPWLGALVGHVVPRSTVGAGGAPGGGLRGAHLLSRAAGRSVLAHGGGTATDRALVWAALDLAEEVAPNSYPAHVIDALIAPGLVVGDTDVLDRQIRVISAAVARLGDCECSGGGAGGEDSLLSSAASSAGASGSASRHSHRADVRAGGGDPSLEARLSSALSISEAGSSAARQPLGAQSGGSAGQSLSSQSSSASQAPASQSSSSSQVPASQSSSTSQQSPSVPQGRIANPSETGSPAASGFASPALSGAPSLGAMGGALVPDGGPACRGAHLADAVSASDAAARLVRALAPVVGAIVAHGSVQSARAEVLPPLMHVLARLATLRTEPRAAEDALGLYVDLCAFVLDARPEPETGAASPRRGLLATLPGKVLWTLSDTLVLSAASPGHPAAPATAALLCRLADALCVSPYLKARAHIAACLCAALCRGHAADPSARPRRRAPPAGPLPPPVVAHLEARMAQCAAEMAHAEMPGELPPVLAQRYHRHMMHELAAALGPVRPAAV